MTAAKKPDGELLTLDEAGRHTASDETATAV